MNVSQKRLLNVILSIIICCAWLYFFNSILVLALCVYSVYALVSIIKYCKRQNLLPETLVQLVLPLLLLVGMRYISYQENQQRSAQLNVLIQEIESYHSRNEPYPEFKIKALPKVLGIVRNQDGSIRAANYRQANTLIYCFTEYRFAER